ncbi:SDR family NAD(P)-dependent oxidoreductase [Kineosporia babensis]|uniref:SDR family NAD(P)-dependent oxidoreductase n=1 Tax=Kineosporia babensis TaxID=499548 RepID=A0A9X1NDI9_9ACTN|nr:SDR family NAD(P)-dependent oxidoreductase [Kineosporia babensis]MCD5311058.1 SDR family NAD(P)-dependent oxidoreductase [Kineosporia babensis]
MNDKSATRRAWIITGPTSGIGYRTALEVAEHGTVVLVGRNPAKLRKVQADIEAAGGAAISVHADLSDIHSARRAAEEVASLDLPLAGLVNNAGIMPTRPAWSEQGWELAFATNHLGPLAFTDALVPALPDGANVVFIASSAEDPEDPMATRAGFRGSRYLSAQATARGEYRPGGCIQPGGDAYATSKQGNLAAVFTLAQEHPQLHFRAVEPGFSPASGLSRDLPPMMKLMTKSLTLIAPLLPAMSTPKRAARNIVKVLTDTSDATGTYSGANGKPMKASRQVSNPDYHARYIAESRALLASVPAAPQK